MKTLFTRIYNHYSKPLLFLLVLLIMAGHIYNCCNFDARPEGYEYGLYASEKVNGEKMRWTWKRSYLCEIAKTDFLGLTVYAAPYNIDKGGLTLDLFVNDNFLDRVHFVESGSRCLYYYLPDITGKNISLKTEVSRTFNPYKLGLSKDRTKNREQGVAVGPVTFLRIMPLDGIGFYDWESWDGEKGNGWPEDMPPEFRWTGIRASMNMQREFKKGRALFLMCAHPDIDKDPVVVEIMRDDDLVRRETFTDNRWKRVVIKAEEVKGSKVLTFRVNRTWNPKLAGISDDGRDLGVAVAIY